MRNAIVRWLTAALFGLFACGSQATPPTLQVETLDHGVFDLADKRGSWVLVNFWATWCAPCLKEMPELDALDREHADISVVGLAFEETTTDELRAFLKQRPVAYPIALVDVYAPPEGWDVPRGLPLSVLVGPDGEVRRKFLGPVTADEVRRAMARGDD